MRLIIGLVSTLGAVLAFGQCKELESPQAQLACFDRLGACLAISSTESRLTCYLLAGEGESHADRGKIPGATPDSEAVVANAKNVEYPATESHLSKAVEAAFPAPKSSQKDSDEVMPEIHSSIVALQKDARGYFYLTLANGHVWREKENVLNRYKEADLVVISKGALGSNQLRLVDKGRMVRVERVK